MLIRLVAGYTILMHDWLLNLGDEKELVWFPKRRQALTWIYLVDKYVSMGVLTMVNLGEFGIHSSSSST